MTYGVRGLGSGFLQGFLQASLTYGFLLITKILNGFIRVDTSPMRLFLFGNGCCLKGCRICGFGRLEVEGLRVWCSGEICHRRSDHPKTAAAVLNPVLALFADLATAPGRSFYCCFLFSFSGFCGIEGPGTDSVAKATALTDIMGKASSKCPLRQRKPRLHTAVQLRQEAAQGKPEVRLFEGAGDLVSSYK